MGNACCRSSEPQLGFNFGGNTIKPNQDPTSSSTNEPKKTINIYSHIKAPREGLILNEQKKAPYTLQHNDKGKNIAPSAISCPMPSSVKPRAINVFRDESLLTLQNQLFLKQYAELGQKILEKINPAKSMLSMRQWQKVVESLHGIYLTATDRMQLMKALYYLLKVEMGSKFNDEQRSSNLLDEDCQINELDFCQEVEKKLIKVKNRVKNRRSKTMEVFSFMRDFKSYNHDLSDFKKVAKRAYDLCKKDIYAFSFITLYLCSCINKQLDQNPRNAFLIMEQLQKIINQLSVIYPPNSLEIEDQEDQESDENLNILSSTYQASINYPIINFQSDDIVSKCKTLEKQIFQRAKMAKKNKAKFDEILRPICLQKGKCFESALKIKTTQSQDILSKCRVYEKIVFHERTEEFKKWEEEQKPCIIEELISGQQQIKIIAFNKSWGRIYTELEEQMLKDKKKVPFCATDMLRGKVQFKSKADISKTVKQIEEKFQGLDQSKYAIVQTQNRIDKPTKDFKINFLIEQTIAELQLAMEINKEQNEFNHKLYELKRAKRCCHVMNLWLINEHLSQKFFDDQLELCNFMIELKDEKFVAGKQDLKVFEQTVLSKNVTAYFGSPEDDYLKDKRQFTQDRKTMLKNLASTFDQIEVLLEKGYDSSRHFNRDQIRKANESFLQTD